MTLNDIYREAVLILEGIENAETDVRIILKKVLSFSETDFLLNKNNEISSDEVALINSMISKRLSGIPVQYIIGEWDFYGSTFKVNENVLIPRPETEILCEYVIDYLDGKAHPVVADLCAGSGCIGITVKKHKKDAQVIMIEKSCEAAEVCKDNITGILSGDGAQLINGDIFDLEKFKTLPLFDVIVSNPPYIKTAEIPTLQSEVLREPEMALDGGEDGLIFYRLIVEKWIDHLSCDGLFAFECGEEQADDIRYMLQNKEFEVRIIKDYNDIDRFVIGKRRKQ